MIWIFIAIFFLSIFLAVRSMEDFGIPREITRIINSRKVRGSIIFFKDKVRHYRAGKS